jgi:hypothetical protein
VTADAHARDFAFRSVELPARSVLMHVGPHKTGTTALQGAFDLASERLRAVGIRYAGRDRTPLRAAITAITMPLIHPPSEADIATWDALAAEVAAAAAERVVISNEFLCEADEDMGARIVSDLGGDRVHVVVTLRPWAEVLPSQWQQFVRNGLRMPYETWLDVTLNNTRPSKTAPVFWRRHDHAALVDRWASVVGADRVTVVVTEASDHGILLRAFESLLGLDAGYLRTEPDIANRSLTLGEVELVRRLNVEFTRRHWSNAHHDAILRHGVIQALRTGHHPGRDEPRISTPTWALERASEAGAFAASRIARRGVRVIGDLSRLAAVPADPVPKSDAYLPSQAAFHAVLGAIVGSGVTDPGSAVGDARPVRDVTSRELTGVLARRLARRLRRAESAAR